jgi:hypothetical protein
VSRNLLGHFKRPLVFKINSDPGSPERMTADRSKDAGINRSPPNHPVSLGSGHCPAGGLFLFEGLKERLIGLEGGFLQVLGVSARNGK